MKLVTFVAGDGRERVGIVDVDRKVVRDVSDVLPPEVGVLDVIERWTELGPTLAAATNSVEHATDSVRFRAPIPEPRRNIFCVGKNYQEHVVEFGRSGYDQPDRSEAIPESAVVFSKATTSVTGPYDEVESHSGVTSELDYEVELAIIIGRGGRSIPREMASGHIWGFTIINDITARDLQRRHKQWLIGKSLDTHCPMGPYAVTADEIPDVETLTLESRVNGQLRQRASVKDLIFDIPELIATLSSGMTLLPGDVIATGTPAGVGIGFDPPRFLTSGDVVEMSITGLGSLRNRIV